MIFEMVGINQKSSNDSDLQERFERINDELVQVWGPETMDDKIEISDVVLDWRFAEYLLKNEIYLNRLKSYVNTIKKNWLSKKAWDSLEDLKVYLDDIWDSEEMEKVYAKFLDKIKNPKDLHKMKDKEIRKLTLYLSMNENVAFQTYQLMRDLKGGNEWSWNDSLMGLGMDTKDINVFQRVWNLIRGTYQNNETFIESEYYGYKSLSANSQSIKSFLEAHRWILPVEWDERDWTELTLAHVCDKKNSIVNKKLVVDRLNEYNNQRIDENKRKIEAIDIVVNVSDFSKADWIIKFKWNEFTPDIMMSTFWNEIISLVKDWDFVNDFEKNRLVYECKEVIFDNLCNKLSFDSDSNGESVDKKTISHEYVVEKDMININDVNLKNKMKDAWFCDSLDEDPVKFDVAKIKEYLGGLQEKTWKQLQNQNVLDKKMWIIAVQVSLNYLEMLDQDLGCGVKVIDWICLTDTMKWISSFQKYNWLKEDGKPWPDTIKKIVEKLWWDNVLLPSKEIDSSISSSNLVQVWENLDENIVVGDNSQKSSSITVEWFSYQDNNWKDTEIKSEPDVMLWTTIQNNSTVSINIDWDNKGKVIGNKTVNTVDNTIDIKNEW